MTNPFTLSHCFPMLMFLTLTGARILSRQLGFNIVEDWNFGDPPSYGGVMLDRTIFHFAEGQPETTGVEIIVYVEGISGILRRIAASRCFNRWQAKRRRLWQTQFGIADLNGYKICFTETTAAGDS